MKESGKCDSPGRFPRLFKRASTGVRRSRACGVGLEIPGVPGGIVGNARSVDLASSRAVGPSTTLHSGNTAIKRSASGV
jgi:hypothetical protein